MDKERNLALSVSLQRVSTFLDDQQIKFLDGLSRRMKFSGGCKLPRTKILRAMLSAFMEMQVDVSKVGDEGELKERILKAVRR
jgi:hypothetical protein